MEDNRWILERIVLNYGKIIMNSVITYIEYFSGFATYVVKQPSNYPKSQLLMLEFHSSPSTFYFLFNSSLINSFQDPTNKEVNPDSTMNS